MQFLCELFIGDAFKLFIVHLLFTFYPSKLAASVSVLHSQHSAALGQSAWDLIGDRCTQSALASPDYLPFCLQSEGGGWCEIGVLPFLIESNLPKLKSSIFAIIVNSGNILAGGWS